MQYSQTNGMLLHHMHMCLHLLKAAEGRSACCRLLISLTCKSEAACCAAV